MVKTLGYMVTWTTYGTWLQGEDKGYVKNGKVLGESRNLRKSNIERLSQKAVRLGAREKRVVREAILEKARQVGQRILAIAVHSNHVHIVLDYDERGVERLVSRYKNAAYFALRKNGFVGRLWTRGYDKRYCFEEKALQDRIDYVQRHG